MTDMTAATTQSGRDSAPISEWCIAAGTSYFTHCKLFGAAWQVGISCRLSFITYNQHVCKHA